MVSLQSLPLHSHNQQGTFPCMVALQVAFILKNVDRVAQKDAQRQRSRSHVCFFVKNAARYACVYRPELMATSSSALATIIGRPREEAPNALRILFLFSLFLNKVAELNFRFVL
ncbi:hypothetical protein HYC85_022331 [Camellia sinensis]|uniref:Uncharacterized protein n=1 Tax=Camellia sinensis TaxID=4442 RepID=A0A7J7GP17_CAMSI|nr:hypothetical protein HYC85_022331 [Camellia sinensis]